MSTENIGSDPGSSEEILLQSARTGNISLLKELLSASSENKITLDANCKGKQKSNLGWTPLHLSCYFGHKDVADLLLKHNVDVNIVNDDGDTPLHKAAYTGREELVLLLLANKADVLIKNGEGLTPKDVAKEDDVRKILKAAEEVDLKKKQDLLLRSAREGDVKTVEELLRGEKPPNINCTDLSGNTALHCAAYRGQKEVAVFLLQSGINSFIKNNRGQLAVDLANSSSMKQILSVQPVKQLQKSATRFEGALLKKTRFLGWKPVWSVLERGVMSFFVSRADAATGTRRKGYKYLDGGQVVLDEYDSAVFVIEYSDNTSQRFSVPYISYQQVDRQKWVNAITEHVEFSTHYLMQGMSDSDSDDELGDFKPLGSLQVVLQTAQAHQQLLEREIISVKKATQEFCLTVENGGNIPYPPREATVRELIAQMNTVAEFSHKVASSLAHCMNLFSQQEEIRMLQLKQEQEKCRVLQDALHVLAQEHHDLERSITISPFASPPRSPVYHADTDLDEFFDAYSGDDSSTPIASPDDFTDEQSTKTPTESEIYHSFASSAVVSLPSPMKELERSKWGRASLPVPMFNRNSFSVWSILKRCIGRELSKITMPVVFNEPLSFLQRITEFMEYSHLINEASNCDDPMKRIEYVTAFAVSALASNWERLGKPFNPLLGETYELIRKEEGFRLVSEQVSHHPPISAFHAESEEFIFYGSIHAKLKFWGKSVDITPEGVLTLHLLKHNEVYTWSNVKACIHNIIVGKLWIEQYGELEITCHTNGYRSLVNFKQAGWFGKDVNCIEGFIYNDKNEEVRLLYGNWTSILKGTDSELYDDYLELKNQQKVRKNSQRSSSHRSLRKLSTSSNKSADESPDSPQVPEISDDIAGPSNMSTSCTVDVPDSVVLWKCDERPEYSHEYYHFTLFAMALNECNEEMKKEMAPTDSRLRPDIKRLEEGDIDGAANEKDRLEDKQRKARKEKTDLKEPMWFKLNSHSHLKQNVWTFKGTYWDRDYSSCPDIF